MRDILGRYLVGGIGTILQIGAARGDLLAVMRRANPRHIVLVEPDPDLAATLAHRIDKAAGETLIRAAISPLGPARQQYFARNLPGLGGLRATNAQMQRLLPGLALKGRPMVDVLRPDALLDRLDLSGGRENWLIVEAAGLEGDILSALRADERLHKFQNILLRAPHAVLFKGATPAPALVAAMKTAGYEALAPALGGDPDWPCHLLRLNPLWQQARKLRADLSAQAQRLEAARRMQKIAQKDLDDLRARQPRPTPVPTPVPTLGPTPAPTLARPQDRLAPPLRSIHHFACTGGTLITRHLSALPNMLTLSEIDPLSTQGQKPTADGRLFAPTDLLALLRHNARAPDQKTLVAVFQGGLAALVRETARQGQHVLLRDHAHSQFCTDCDWRARPTLLEMLRAQHRTRALVTVRHPLDSYLSLKANGWLSFTPPTLAEYSRRYLAFLKAHAGLEIIRYEDFVAAPDATLARLCAALDLPAPTGGLADLLPAFPLSGDSGRRGQGIAPRPRRKLSGGLRAEIASGATAPYGALCAGLGYEADA